MRQRLAAASSEAIVPKSQSIVITENDRQKAQAMLTNKLTSNGGATSELGNAGVGGADMDDESPSASADGGTPAKNGASGKSSGSTIVTNKKARLGHTISVVSNDQPRSGKLENYRVMFHVMTNDHKMPDLIWNEQTRLELRTALEAELKEFDREQRLRAAKIVWNYQQFKVLYPSLRDEMKVGNVYIRHFLESNDSFIVGLENPSHIVLFEKLFRRVLVNVEKMLGFPFCARGA